MREQEAMSKLLTDGSTVPSRIWYYLLDWRDFNTEEYVKKHGNKPLRELTRIELYDLFKQITQADNNQMLVQQFN